MTMHRIDNIRDFQALPVALQYAIRYSGHNPQNLRFVAKIRTAERKQMIHKAVADAIINKAIGVELGISILKSNKAYGPQGKSVIAAALEQMK